MEDNLIEFASHYLRRSRELGIMGSIRSVAMRLARFFATRIQSLWWGWTAHQKVKDATLLAHTTGKWRSVDELLYSLAERPDSSFLLAPDAREETTLLLKRSYPQYVLDVVEAADAICRNELDLLGQTFCFPDGIDWHCDPSTGWRWPICYRIQMGQHLYSQAEPYDPILLWELNRHQHFVTLGIAYWLTGGQKYAEAFVSQVLDWIEKNPLRHGINWYYPLEVSIRLLAWISAFQFFRGSSLFLEKAGGIFLKSVWQQADFLNRHLQVTREVVPNNHLMAELTGLVMVGVVFPEFRESVRWREAGLQLLAQQIVEQNHSDGVNKEQATGYHRFVAELLLLIVVQCRRGRLPANPVFDNMLARMLDYVFYSLSPLGMSPAWGDSDYGRALGLGQKKDFWDFRPLLSVGVALFDRPDWKFASGCFDAEAFWLLGMEGLERWCQVETNMPSQTSYAFPQAGHYVIRNSWKPDADVAFFRCGPFGLGGNEHCAHAHADLLSFTLWMKGKQILIDSGTYTYHGVLRDHFRLTSAHNTVMVDGLEQAVPIPNFNWQGIPNSKSIRWTGNSVTGELVYVNGVKFMRELQHLQTGVWVVVDSFVSDGNTHTLAWFFHFAENLGLCWDEARANIIVAEDDVPCLEISLPERVCVEVKSDWISRYYGQKKASPMLLATWEGEVPSSGVSFCWKFMNTNSLWNMR